MDGVGVYFIRTLITSKILIRLTDFEIYKLFGGVDNIKPYA